MFYINITHCISLRIILKLITYYATPKFSFLPTLLKPYFTTPKRNVVHAQKTQLEQKRRYLIVWEGNLECSVKHEYHV
jgi:hypothetical protein